MSNSGLRERLISEALRHHGAGNLREAERLYRQVLSQKPKDPAALHFLGVIALQTNQPETAIQLIRDAILQQPDYVDAFSNLGNALQASGQFDEAVKSYERALALKPMMAETRANLGNARSQLQQFKLAASDYRSALAMKPDLPEVHRNLSMVLLALGKTREALQSIVRARELNPHSLEILTSLGNILQESGKWGEAVNCYKQVLQAQPDSCRVHCNLGNVLRKLGNSDEATSHYERALEINPDYAEGNYNRGLSYLDAGDLGSAEASFRSAIAADAKYGLAHLALASLVDHTQHDSDISDMESAFADPLVKDEQKQHLAFGLGKSFEDLKQHKLAFRYYAQANALVRKTFSYDMAKEERFFANLKSAFSAEFCASQLFLQDDAESIYDTPIFIFGMPRSGTSLVEQIIASHSQIHGAGELNTFSLCVARKLKLLDGVDYTEKLGDMRSDDFRSIGLEYAKALRALAPNALHVTDKMPMNFLNAGMIRLVLPGARMIHCQRSPVDTCLSIYKNFFAASGHRYAYDLAELGRYYTLYLDLMAHWQNVLPGVIYAISYENLIANQESESRQLIDFCGLEWDPACIEFHKTSRQVTTISSAQVRKPVYRDSVELWRNYEEELSPLIAALDARDS